MNAVAVEAEISPEAERVYRIAQQRAAALERLRADPQRIAGLRAYYRDHIADFIDDWGVTVDPRNVAYGLPAVMPFKLFPKQRELVDWIIERMKGGEPGIIEKSRDVGASWLAMAVAASLCLLHENVAIGIGSAKEVKLDRSGDPDTLFYKARTFVECLPPEFRGGYQPGRDSLYLRLLFPATGGSITGEAGDNMGRGGRKLLYFVDEAAHLERPQLVTAALLANTDCRIDISSVSMDGMSNDFAKRRHSGNVKVFTLHYRDDLRKDEAWRKKKQAETDPVIWNAEYELNYTAAAEGVIIPQEWVQAAIDAHKKLSIEPSGSRRGALDVADLGRDLNCFSARHGILVEHCEVWSGKESDLFATTERAFLLCDELRLEGFDYDADGMGSGVRGDAKRISERRREQGLLRRQVEAYRGSAAVFQPDRIVPGTDRKALDMFQNLGAQACWLLRGRFQNTFRAVNGLDYDPDNLISLSLDIPDLQKLCIELSQYRWVMSLTGKIAVDKQPDGVPSPNRADAIRMLFAPRSKPMRILDSVFDPEET